LRGQPVIDSKYNLGRSQNVTGGRLADGMRSAFFHVLIVADPTKLGEFEIGAIADYVALLALSQPSAPQACQDLASITDLTTAGCRPGMTPKAITGNDTAYLRALYKTTLGGSLRMQKDEIALGMGQTLERH
jgi:hypothetical protein